MQTLTKYENLTGKEVKIVDIPYVDDEGIKHDLLGFNICDYTSPDLVNKNDRDSLQIFVDYINQFRWLTENQLNCLCQRFVEIWYNRFSKDDISEEFGI